MDFLLVSASPKKSGASARMLTEISEVFKASGANAEIFELGGAPRSACIACGECRRVGACVMGDIGVISDKIRRSSGVIFATPTHYGGAVGTLCSVLSRICFSARDAFDGKPVACIAAARRAGAVTAIEQVNRFFTFTDAVIVGCGYPPHIYGGERDGEGLCYARALAARMLYLSECIALGEKSGIAPPIKQEIHRVNI